MIIFEARNSYELLVSFLLGQQPKNAAEPVCILGINLDPKLEYGAIEQSGLVMINVQAGRFQVTRKILAGLCRHPAIRLKDIRRIFVFHEISPLSLCGIFGKQVNLVEHGEINYHDITKVYPKTHPYRLLKWLFGHSFVGEGRLFSTVYLKSPRSAQSAIQTKARQLDLASLYASMPLAQKAVLCNLFVFSPVNLSKNGPARLIVTQPFSELGMMSETQKVAMYRAMIAQGDGAFYIKPHPKEKTDYSKVFPDVQEVFDPKIPFELLWLTGLRELEVYTVHSSIGRISGLKIVRLGEAFLSEYCD